MRQKFNVFDLPDVLPAVLDAFSAEEITLKMHAERLRKLIDAKSGNKDDGEEGLAGGDKPSLETALKDLAPQVWQTYFAQASDKYR